MICFIIVACIVGLAGIIIGVLCRWNKEIGCNSFDPGCAGEDPKKQPGSSPLDPRKD